MAQEVQRDTLACQERSGPARYRREDGSSLHDVAIDDERAGLHRVVEEREHPQRGTQAGHTSSGSGDDVGHRLRVLGNRRDGGDVTRVGQILGERGA